MSKNCVMCKNDKSYNEFKTEQRKLKNGDVRKYIRRECYECYKQKLKSYYLNKKDVYIKRAKDRHQETYKPTGKPKGRPRKIIELEDETIINNE